MEKICEDYYLGANKNNFILYERKINEEGTESYKKIGDYTSLEALYNALIQKEVKEDLSVIHNIQKINELVAELKEFTVNYKVAK